MLLNDLTAAAMDDAAPAIGDEPVAVVDLLWLRDASDDEPGFTAAKLDVRWTARDFGRLSMPASSRCLGCDL